MKALLLIPVLFLGGCPTPSASLAKYQNEIRPVAKKEADAFTDFAFETMCEYRTDRVNRTMEKKGPEWAMGYALMCKQQWQAMRQAMESAGSVPPPTFQRKR